MKIAFDAHCFCRPLDSMDRVLRVLLHAADHVGLETELWSSTDLRDDAAAYAEHVRPIPKNPPPSTVFWSTELTGPPLDMPSVAMLHDINPLLPDGRNVLSRWRRQNRYRQSVNHALKQVDRLATISDDSQQRIVAAFPKAESKISTVPLYVDPHIRPLLGESGKRLLAEHRLTSGFMLFVGSMRKHKNWDGLMRAYAKLPQGLKSRHPLVYVGRNKRAEKDALSLAEHLGLSEDIRLTGVVSDPMLHALYGGAAVLVCPSFMEGFGFPALEAMACGVPVVASDRTCIPEVLGDAPLYINPDDFLEMTRAMEILLTDESRRTAHISAGLDRAKQFNADRTGRAMLDVLNRL